MGNLSENLVSSPEPVGGGIGIEKELSWTCIGLRQFAGGSATARARWTLPWRSPAGGVQAGEGVVVMRVGGNGPPSMLSGA
jgi:hypothetical protein